MEPASRTGSRSCAEQREAGPLSWDATRESLGGRPLQGKEFTQIHRRASPSITHGQSREPTTHPPATRKWSRPRCVRGAFRPEPHVISITPHAAAPFPPSRRMTAKRQHTTRLPPSPNIADAHLSRCFARRSGGIDRGPGARDVPHGGAVDDLCRRLDTPQTAIVGSETTAILRGARARGGASPRAAAIVAGERCTEYGRRGDNGRHFSSARPPVGGVTCHPRQRGRYCASRSPWRRARASESRRSAEHGAETQVQRETDAPVGVRTRRHPHAINLALPNRQR